MSDLAERIALLSPEKRALLAARLARSELPVRGLQQDSSVAAPLSYTQRSVWFLDQLYPGNVAYNSPIAVRFSGRLDPNALEWSWNEVIRRHDLLRTVFEPRGGDPVQYATPFRPVRLHRVELGHLAESERMGAAREEAVREAQQPFDLAKGQPWRAKLLRCSEREHVLVFILHHIVCDGWSIGVLVRELMAGYEAFLKGKTAPLAELPIQYRDYVAWQGEQLAGPGFQGQVELWRKRLEGVTGAVQFPLDKPRPAEATFRGARIFTQLSPALTESLRRIAHSEGATLFMVLLGAFKALLSRYSGESDIVLGSPFANRERREFEGLIGFFANTLALRTDLSGDPTFVELLARVRETTLGAYDSQEVPFEKLVEELRPERQLNRNPFFDISFSLQNLPMPAVNVPDLSIDLLRVDNGTSKFDLSVVVVETERGLATTVEYSSDLLDAGTPERLLRHYRTLLEGIVAGPERRLSELSLLDEQERRQVMIEWNRTERHYRQDRCIHELIDEQVERTPEAVAVSFGDQRLTYRELNIRSNRLAHDLRAAGVGPDVPVGLCIERSQEMIVGLLGILKAGAAYVPIDPTHPQDRLAFIMADAGARTLITGTTPRPWLEERAAEIVRLSSEVGAGAEDVPAVLAVSPDSLAYILYTSGSTGQPKGVEVTHRSVVNLLHSLAETPGVTAVDTVLALTTLSFDISVAELFLPLSVGARIILAGDEAGVDVSLLKQLIEEFQPTIIQATPSRWRLLLEAGWKATPNQKIFCTGEALPRELARQLTAMSPSVWNLYGPTETTVFSSIARVGEGPVHVGRPIANTRTYILDAKANPMPVGVPGELYIGGLGVSRGYRNRPKLTEERFPPDPFDSDHQGRLFRTGDVARYLSGGEIECLGRLDNQVKIRGFRIELGEIEAVLRQAPGVGEAVTVVREDITGERRVVAYVVPKNAGQIPSIEHLRSLLKQKLPDYMVPSAFAILEKLPLTPSGKIDRLALPAPERRLDGYRPPRTPEEEILCKIFANVLGLERVGIAENFFELGGHSLLGMQLVSRIRNTFGVEIALRLVFEAPTVAELVERVFRAERAAAPLVRTERPERLPLSFAQQRLWFLCQHGGSGAEYNMREALRLRGELDAAALERAINALVERHEILRTRFDDHDGEPYQLIEQEMKISLRWEDLCGLDEELRQEAIDAALRREAAEPFDLANGSLFRIGLLKLGPQDHVLHWTCHHIISDGWSADVFCREFEILYMAFSEGRPTNLAQLPIQYADFALWQRRQMQGSELDRLVNYWRGQLADLPALALATDLPRPSHPNVQGGIQTRVLPPSLCKDLQSFGSREGATMAMVLLAAFELLLARLSGQDDVAVGVPIAGRSSIESERLIGLFLNTLVLRAKLDGTLTFRQLLAQVRKSSLEAYAHQEMPFEKLVEVLNPERVLNRHPLFDVLFNYLSGSRPTLNLPGLSVERLRPEGLHAKFPMTLYVEEVSGGMMLRLAYQTALFLPERIGQIVDQFHYLLLQIAENPDVSIGSYSLVTEAARRLLPDPRISLAEPSQVPVPHGFLSCAARHPQQIALSQEGEQWTYQQLAASATKIAKLLGARGLRPGHVVAVSGPRSFGLISGIMGVLMARGVLLMLDSALPPGRRDVMLQAASGKHWLVVGDPETTGEEWSARFWSLPRTQISCDGERVRAEGWSVPEGEIFCQAEPEDAAYVFFTSGTTGTPKGILGTHKGLSHFLLWEQQTLSVSSGDRVAQLTGLSFDVVLRDIFLPLTAGATLCLPDSASGSYENLIIPWLLRERITILHTVPSLASAWLDGLDSPFRLPDLRWVLFAGEPLTDSLVRRWREMIGMAGGVFNLYGPTETTLAKCAYQVSEEVGAGVQPIGGPLPNTQALLINQVGQLCGIGEPGEIVVRTPFRTLGYLDDSPEARPAFTPNPFRADPTDLLYRTGDLGCYDSHGWLLISGRLDDQVKIRGNRVEPAEISAALSRHPDIRQSAVVVYQEESGEQVLVAYVQEEPTSKLRDLKELRSFLKRSLPDYMIPVFFLRLDKLPLTANGKLDRKALPAPDMGCLQSTQDYVAPRDSIEHALADLWKMLLRLDDVGIYEDFFELGGHSLTATRLVSHIRREFDVEIPLRAIFENPTIESLAIQIVQKRAGSVTSASVEDILRDLESAPAEPIEEQVIAREPGSSDFAATRTPFHCPKTPSRLFGARQCNLLIVINERFERPGFEKLACYVREFDPTINPLVIGDQASMEIRPPRNPTLIFSPALIRHRPPVEGRIFCGYPLSKSQEYLALEKAGIPVPKWTLLSEGDLPALSGFDDYLVWKPDHGGRGAEVKIVRKSRVKWKPVTTRSAGECSSVILQQFIYTGPRPVSYRVSTLFGRVLHSRRYEARNDLPSRRGQEDGEFSGRSIVASARGSRVTPNYEEDIIRFGERAHAAFPEIPLLGFDIVREVPSGDLYVLEANAIGYVWSFRTQLEASFGFSAERQFDGLRKAAYILAEKTQQSAL